MKYTSPCFTDFEFHDAVFELVSLHNGQLTIHAKALNIRQSAPQNDHPTDMEITLARLSFRDFRAVSFDPGQTWKQDARGNWHTDDPLVVYEGAQAEERLLHELHHGLSVLKLAPDDSGAYRIEGTGDEPWFTAQFTCSSLLIEWDEYLRPAWYVKKRRDGSA